MMAKMFPASLCEPRLLAGRSVLLAVLLLAPAAAIAARPEVEFDASQTVTVADATTAEFAAAHRDRKLIAARIDLSALVRRGDAGDLVDIVYRIETSLDDRDAPIVFDFAPKTTLAADVAGSIAVDRQTDASRSFQGSGRGQYFPFASASAALSSSANEQTTAHYELLPAKQLVAASGTIGRGRGAFFKLRASRQTSLEGAKSFVIVLDAPRGWRASTLRISAEARSIVGGAMADNDEATTCGRSEFFVAMHQAGDREARDTAAALAAAQQKLAQSDAALVAYRKPDVTEKMRRALDDVTALVDAKKRKSSSASATSDRLATDVKTAARVRDRIATQLAMLNATDKTAELASNSSGEKTPGDRFERFSPQ
jgi:hypothetical protein